MGLQDRYVHYKITVQHVSIEIQGYSFPEIDFLKWPLKDVNALDPIPFP